MLKFLGVAITSLSIVCSSPTQQKEENNFQI